MPNKLSNFWQELKRRKVIRTITVYAAAAFVILELLSIIIEPLRLPDWTLQFAIIFLCIGFIVAIILSWIYDLHPEGGIVKTESVEEARVDDIPKSSNGWKIASYISFAVILGLIVLNILSNNQKSRKIGKLEKSIAVLPFENWNSDEDNAHMGDAIANEINTQLAKIKEFHVFSYTSSSQYKGSDKPSIPQIGKELGANFIIEGTVERQSDDVSIHVQVIHADNDDHIWAREFKGNWKDIFTIRADIAVSIAKELKTILSPEEIEQIEKKPTENSKAYEIYLLGRYNLRIGLEHNLLESISYFKQALKHDPDYAQAYAGLADAYASLGIFNIQSPEDTWSNAQAMARKALELDEQISEVYISLLIVKMYYEYDWRGIETVFKKAIDINPNNSDAYAWYSMYLSAVGRHTEALSYIEYALDIDPFSQFVKRNYFYVSFFAGEKDKAWQFAENEMILNSRFPYWLWRTAFLYADSEKYPEAISHVKKQISLMGDDINDAVGFLGYLYGRNGEPGKALQQLEKLDSISISGRNVSPVNRAFIYIGLDENQKAIECLEESFEKKSAGWLMAFIKVLYIYDPIREEPRFIELVNKMGLNVY
jgi:TolB-like protein/Tfp pilus assembly protein PilF